MFLVMSFLNRWMNNLDIAFLLSINLKGGNQANYVSEKIIEQKNLAEKSNKKLIKLISSRYHGDQITPLIVFIKITSHEP